MKKLAIFIIFSLIAYSGICQDKVSVYWNQNKEVVYFLDKSGLIEKKIVFASSTEIDTVHYFYKLSVIDSISYKGLGELFLFEEELDKKEIADAKAFIEYLDEFKIHIPYPYLNIDILKEISSIYEGADKKYKVNIDKNHTQFVFKRLNKRYDFRTGISKFIL